MQKKIPRGLITYLILRMMAEEPTYGYELVKRLEEKSRGHWNAKYGAVYGALERLEEAGYISRIRSEREDRKYYALTPSGQEKLQRMQEDIKQRGDKSRDMILGFLNVYREIYGEEKFGELLNSIAGEFPAFF